MAYFQRFLPLIAGLALAACGGDVSSSLGISKSAPDEFVVVSRPPLVVPPDFDLTPPRPGEESPHAVSTEQQARKLLLGTDEVSGSETPTLDEFMGEPKVETAVTPVIASDAPTASSSNFLKSAGADTADPDIRKQLGQDVAKPVKVKEATSLYEDIMGNDQQEPVVDPAKESERLRSNKDTGKPVTEGETPTRDETPKSVIDRVF